MKKQPIFSAVQVHSILIFGTVAALFAVARSASAVTLTPLASPAAFSLPTTVDTFETDIVGAHPANTAEFTFESTAIIASAFGYTDGVTPSGSQGLSETFEVEPMRIVFTTPVKEVGMYFGNDDFGDVFNTNLELFDAANVSLGKVQVLSNGNDFADQFIGVRSDVNVKSAAISYDRPNAGQLSIYIDDLRVGSSVPEPSTIVLFIAGLALTCKRVSRRRK